MRTPTFLQFILIEDRIDDLKAAKPHLASEIDSYAAHDPTPQKKFVPWLISQHERGNITPDLPHIGQTLSNFETFRDRLSQKDHTKYDYHNLKNELDVISSKGTGHPSEVTAIDKGEFGKRNMSVFHVTTHEAMKSHYGITSPHGLSWCIAADNDLAPFGKNGGYGPTYTIHVDNDNLSPYAYHPKIEKITNRFNHGTGGWGDATVEDVITHHAPHLAPVLDTIRRYHHKIVNQELSRQEPLYYRSSDEILTDLNLPPTVAHDQIRKLQNDKSIRSYARTEMFKNISKMKSLDESGISDLIDLIHEYTDKDVSRLIGDGNIQKTFRNLFNNKNLSSDHIHKLIDKHVVDSKSAKIHGIPQSEAFEQKFGQDYEPHLYNHPNYNLTHTQKLFDYVHGDDPNIPDSPEETKSLVGRRTSHFLTDRLYSLAPLADKHIDHAYEDEAIQPSIGRIAGLRLNPNLTTDQNERVIDEHLSKLESHVASTAPEVFVPSVNTRKLREETNLENKDSFEDNVGDLAHSAGVLNVFMEKKSVGHKVNSRLLNLVNDIHHATDYHKLIAENRTPDRYEEWAFDDKNHILHSGGNPYFLNQLMHKTIANLAKSADFVRDNNNVNKLLDVWENHPQIRGLRHDTHTSHGQQYPDDFAKSANRVIAKMDANIRGRILGQASNTGEKVSAETVKRILTHPTAGVIPSLAHNFYTTHYGTPHFEITQELSNLPFSRHMHKVSFNPVTFDDYTEGYPNPTAEKIRRGFGDSIFSDLTIPRDFSGKHKTIREHLLLNNNNPTTETITHAIMHNSPFRDYGVPTDEQHTLSPEHKHGIVKDTIRNLVEFTKKKHRTASESELRKELDDTVYQHTSRWLNIFHHSGIKNLPNFGKANIDAIMEHHDSLHRISSDENEDPHVRYAADSALARMNMTLAEPIPMQGVRSYEPDVKATKRYYSFFKPEHIDRIINHHMEKPTAYDSLSQMNSLSPIAHFSRVDPKMISQEVATKLFFDTFPRN